MIWNPKIRWLLLRAWFAERRYDRCTHQWLPVGEDRFCPRCRWTEYRR